MFNLLLAQLVSRSTQVTRREEGVAFFKVAKDLYHVASVCYFCVNIPSAAPQRCYAHCVYSDSGVIHCFSQGRIAVDIVDQAGFSSTIYGGPQEWPQHDRAADGGVTADQQRCLTFPLRQQQGESPVFGITALIEPTLWDEQKSALLREFRILANYFHSHVLRINGHNSDRDILISAKELDCLKWTAAGKTAWEASVILGISERTVRFHLNTAREKLNCATTTQAVAKAIANQLIDI